MARITQLQIGRTDGGYVLRLEGRGTALVSPTVFDLVMQLWSAGKTGEEMIVDLSDCEYLDSTMMGCLVGLHRKMNTADSVRFLIAAPINERSMLFGTTRLETIFVFAQRVPVPFEDFVPIEDICLDSLEMGEHMVSAHRALADTVPEGGDVFDRIAARLSLELAEKKADAAATAEPDKQGRTDLTEALS